MCDGGFEKSFVKIAIIGYSGSGKSTLAQALGVRLDGPVLHLDKVHFAPNWVERPDAEAEQEVLAFLEHPDWVIEGNYSSIAFERRMAEADEILFLDFSRLRCLWRAVKRYLTHRGKTRSSMTEDCPEKFDWEFFLWLVRDGRNSVRRARFVEVVRRYPHKARRLRHPQDVTGYLAELDL